MTTTKRIYRIIENAGYEREQDIGGSYASIGEALATIRRMYDPDEIEDLHVQIMLQLPDGSLTSEY